MSFALCHAAGNMFAPERKRFAAYNTAAANGDIATFTEVQKDHAQIEALPGFDSVTVTELAIAWKTDRFTKVGSGSRRVMVGGKAGDGQHKADKRKRGPDRYLLWVALRETATGQPWLICLHHAIAKVDTSFLWRRWLWNQCIKNAAAEIRLARGLHPGAQTVLTGDFNRQRGVDLKLGLTEVKTPGTLGKNRYDRVQIDRDVRASGVKTLPTGLDHKALVVRLSVMGATPTSSPVPPEVPVTQQDKVIAAVNAEIGYHEGRSGGHWNNKEKFAAQVPGLKWVSDQGQPWCAVFAAWGFLKGGLEGGKDFPVTASCDVGGNWYKARKRWSEYPAVGAQVFFGSPRDLNHTGIVTGYDAEFVYTTEGNTNNSGSREGDGVYAKKHRRREVNVVGYGYPLYDGSIKSADPAWAGKPTTPGKPPPRPGAVTPWPIDGIDLSHHNSGRIDWALAKAGGVKFVYHKATQHIGFRDSMYASRRAEVKAQRVLFGAYHYAQPNKSSGTAQAKFFLAVAKPRKGELRPMLDLEETGGLSMAALTKWVRQFVAEVKRQTGKPPVIYTKFDLTAAPGSFLWTARYSNVNAAPHVPVVWAGWTIHQFSNGEFGSPRRCPGIDFPCDLNTLAPGFDLNRLKL